MCDVMSGANDFWFCLSYFPVEFTGLRGKEKLWSHPRDNYLFSLLLSV